MSLVTVTKAFTSLVILKMLKHSQYFPYFPFLTVV